MKIIRYNQENLNFKYNNCYGLQEKERNMFFCDDKLRYTYKQEVAINKLLLKDLTSTIFSEIDQLNSTDRKIAILFFIYEYNISEISRILDLHDLYTSSVISI